MHGTITAYINRACRCDECRGAMRVYRLARQRGEDGILAVDEARRLGLLTVRQHVDEACDRAFGDLLHELFPDGLTDDCPVRRTQLEARSAA